LPDVRTVSGRSEGDPTNPFNRRSIRRKNFPEAGRNLGRIEKQKGAGIRKAGKVTGLLGGGKIFPTLKKTGVPDGGSHLHRS